MNDVLQGDLVRWRHHLHQIAETGFEESETSDFVAKILRDMGLDVHRGIGGTGIVAILRGGRSERAVGLRADLDALNIVESAPNRPYASCTHGKMHACGHDGHMAMVLGAARLLSESRDFDGTVYFVFQPAEEHGLGAKAMMKDGLFQRFPMDAIFGAHNMPGMRQGSFSTRSGGIMASEDNFVIRIRAKGTHAARPHMGIDPIVIGAQVILGLQTIISRSLDPALPAVISCTEMFTDGIRNAIPSNVTIKGDTRSYSPDVQDMLETRMREVCEGICRAHGADCEFEYTHEFAPTINTPECVGIAVAAASIVAGAANVDADVTPLMASEDFGAFLQVIPGNFIFIGNGVAREPGAVPLHNASYDFNDANL
ncbi:MAG TPA: M20 aminoacylase family protein, partial [Candidatus Angelobacter sp.]|nr:M20 aminoacylase family protein [Candidatus Angelobacter sp.]